MLLAFPFYKSQQAPMNTLILCNISDIIHPFLLSLQNPGETDGDASGIENQQIWTILEQDG